MSNDLLRATGRTTNMIREAYDYSWTVGKPAFIFVADGNQKRQLHKLWMTKEIRQDLVVSSNKIEQKYIECHKDGTETKRTRLLVAFYTMQEAESFSIHLGRDISVGQIFVDHFAREQDIK